MFRRFNRRFSNWRRRRSRYRGARRFSRMRRARGNAGRRSSGKVFGISTGVLVLAAVAVLFWKQIKAFLNIK